MIEFPMKLVYVYFFHVGRTHLPSVSIANFVYLEASIYIYIYIYNIVYIKLKKIHCFHYYLIKIFKMKTKKSG